MNINFKLLQTFMLVAEHGSFSKAAESGNRSLPAISMQIRQLEEQLGVPLFQRTTRRVELTAHGSSLLISVRRAMSELEGGLAKISQAADLELGSITFATVPTIASTRLPAILTRFARQYPNIRLRVHELSNVDLIQSVRSGEADFGIGIIPDKRMSDLAFTPIFTDEYRALLPEDYPLAANAEISLRELSRLPLLKPSAASTFRDQIDEALAKGKLDAATVYEFAHVHTIVAMAEAGLGVALLPRIAVPRDTRLRAARIVRPVLSRRVAVVTLRGNTLSPAAARLAALCREAIPPD